ncbi:heparinase II/III family protein [Rhodobacteraceae bacterium DSL-40]|uniref:heparinase II/III family protein n=1 Tax=Amaricoccus sp. B4 TaxID=3368557 RepID=UPI000DAD3231
MRQSLLQKMKNIELDIEKSSHKDKFYPLSFCYVMSREFDERAALKLLGDHNPSFERLLAEMFPLYDGAPLEGALPERSADLSVRIPGFPEVRIPSPIDWAVHTGDIYRWRLEFHGLKWLPDACAEGRAGRRSAERAILDFQDFVLNRAVPLDFTWDRFTWGDVALAIRTNALLEFLDTYLESPRNANRQVVLAAIQILVIQIAAMLNENCYTTGHNHGLFQDVALLRIIGRCKGMYARDEILEHVSQRICDLQMRKSLVGGMHVENSPEYHLLFVRLALRAAGAEALGQSAKKEIADALSQALRSLCYFVVPPSQIVPFGDTARRNVQQDFRKIWRRARRDTLLGSRQEIMDVVDFLRSSGDERTPDLPKNVVFKETGYACFRNGWMRQDVDTSSRSATCVFLKCGSASKIHKHDDDGSVQIFAFGQELILDPGKFSNDRAAPGSRQTNASASHSLLLLDDGQGGVRSPRRSRILRYATEGTPWVLCERVFGSERLLRALVLFEEGGVLVVDIAGSKSRLSGWSQFLLSPTLSLCERESSPGHHRFEGESGVGMSISVLGVAGADRCTPEHGKLNFAESHFHPALGRREPAAMAQIRFDTRGGPAALAVFLQPERAGGPPTTAPAIRRTGGDLVIATGKERISIPVEIASTTRRSKIRSWISAALSVRRAARRRPPKM